MLTSLMKRVECSSRSLAFVVLLGFGTWAYRKVRELERRKKQLPFEDIPYVVPNPHWFLGHLPLLGQDVVQGQYRVCVQHAGGSSGLSSFYTLGVPVLSILNAKTAERVLKLSSDRRGHPITVRHFKKMFGQQSLLMINGKQWRANRDIVQRSFAHASLPELEKSILHASLRVERALLATIEKEPTGVYETDAVVLSRIASLDVFGLSSLGHDFGCTKRNKLEQSDVFRMTGFLQSEVTRRCYHQRTSLLANFYWIPTPLNRRHKRESRLLRETIRDIIQERRHEIADTDKPTRNDLLGSVLKGSDGFTELSDEFLSDWMITMLFGGYETSSLGLTYVLYLLAKYPEYQKDCAKEAERMLGKESGDANLEALELNDLPFISACFWEALRLYPPTTITARNLDRATTLDVDGKKVTLPKDARILFSIYWIHHSEMNFPNPDDYLPERWAQKEQGEWVQRTPENDSGGEVPMGRRNSMLSFSAGARNCVGQPLGLRMIPALVAVLVRSFEFDLADPLYELKLERYGGSQVPTGGIPLKIRRRKRHHC